MIHIRKCPGVGHTRPIKSCLGLHCLLTPAPELQTNNEKVKPGGLVFSFKVSARKIPICRCHLQLQFGVQFGAALTWSDA